MYKKKKGSTINKNCENIEESRRIKKVGTEKSPQKIDNNVSRRIISRYRRRMGVGINKKWANKDRNKSIKRTRVGKWA